MSNSNQPLTFGATIIAAWIGGCLASGPTTLDNRMDRKLDQLVATAPVLKFENVVGGPTMEMFYEINGQRCYVQIDGKPVEEYLNNYMK